MRTSPYEMLDRLFSTIFRSEEGVEPLLVADQVPSKSPRRLLLVRYLVAEGAGGEGGRPIFKNELTGYDYEMKLTYPTQTENLDRLQTVMEASMYASSAAFLTRALIRNLSTGQERYMKAVISEKLVSEIAVLYCYAW
jgi:hypothetical protein